MFGPCIGSYISSVKYDSKVYITNTVMKQKEGSMAIWAQFFKASSFLRVKMLTDLVSTIPNSQVFLLKKCEYLLQISKNMSVYAIFYNQSFNDMLTNNIVSFEQLGSEVGAK